MLTSNVVTAEDAIRYDGHNLLEIINFGEGYVIGHDNVLVVCFIHKRHDYLRPNQWLVKYASGDFGIMDDNAYRRWFGSERD